MNYELLPAMCSFIAINCWKKLMTTKHNKRPGTAYLFKCVSKYEVDFALFQLHTYLC